ncbi:hypothetical protein D3C86_2261270 [compost metagenome]
MVEQVAEYFVVCARQAGKPDKVDRSGAVHGGQQLSWTLKQWQHRDPKSCFGEH